MNHPLVDASVPDEAPALARLARYWGSLLALGFLVLVAGLAALTLTYALPLGSPTVCGVLLLAGGGLGVGLALLSGKPPYFLLDVQMNFLMAVIGLLVLNRPHWGAAALPLVASGILLTRGVIRLFGGLALGGRPNAALAAGGLWYLGWGVLIWMQGAFLGLRSVGLLLAVEAARQGWNLCRVAARLRRATAGAEPPETSVPGLPGLETVPVESGPYRSAG